MPLPALSAEDMAQAFGRKIDWFYHNWKRLVREGMPPPVESDGLLVWDAAQFYAWRDRNLPQEMRAACAAYRAAAAAYANAEDPDGAKSLADWKSEISRRLAEREHAPRKAS